MSNKWEEKGKKCHTTQMFISLIPLLPQILFILHSSNYYAVRLFKYALIKWLEFKNKLIKCVILYTGGLASFSLIWIWLETRDVHTSISFLLFPGILISLFIYRITKVILLK